MDNSYCHTFPLSSVKFLMKELSPKKSQENLIEEIKEEDLSNQANSGEVGKKCGDNSPKNTYVERVEPTTPNNESYKIKELTEKYNTDYFSKNSNSSKDHSDGEENINKLNYTKNSTSEIPQIFSISRGASKTINSGTITEIENEKNEKKAINSGTITKIENEKNEKNVRYHSNQGKRIVHSPTNEEESHQCSIKTAMVIYPETLKLTKSASVNKIQPNKNIIKLKENNRAKRAEVYKINIIKAEKTEKSLSPKEQFDLFKNKPLKTITLHKKSSELDISSSGKKNSSEGMSSKTSNSSMKHISNQEPQGNQITSTKMILKPGSNKKTIINIIPTRKKSNETKRNEK